MHAVDIAIAALLLVVACVSFAAPIAAVILIGDRLDRRSPADTELRQSTTLTN